MYNFDVWKGSGCQNPEYREFEQKSWFRNHVFEAIAEHAIQYAKNGRFAIESKRLRSIFGFE